MSPPSRPQWPHAPPHWTFAEGAYFVTASTYHRRHFFDSPSKLSLVTDLLLIISAEYGWTLRTWAVFSSRCHFLADSPPTTGETLRLWLREFDRRTALENNRLCATPEQRVWMNFRETRITHQRSLMARIRYVHENPVKHGLARRAEDYPWCSAAWFEASAPRSFVTSVSRFKTDRLDIPDDFDP